MKNNQSIGKLISFILIFSSIFYPLSSLANGNSFNHSISCTTKIKHYTIGFFNGVWNTKAQAKYNGLVALKNLMGENSYAKYELFYNDTGTNVGATAVQDVAEVFIQRANEIDSSKNLSKHFEILMEIMSGVDKNSLIQTIKNAVPKLIGEALNKLYEDLATKFAAALSKLLSHPPTDANYVQHNERLLELAQLDEMFLFVAHSQGNLFANHAYDFIAPTIQKNHIAVVHIAPASPTLRGDYILSNHDLVINTLRAQGVNSVPDNNISIPYSKNDVFGHYLIETYLDQNRPGRMKIKNLIQDAESHLDLEPDTDEFHRIMVGFDLQTQKKGWNINKIKFKYSLENDPRMGITDPDFPGFNQLEDGFIFKCPNSLRSGEDTAGNYHFVYTNQWNGDPVKNWNGEFERYLSFKDVLYDKIFVTISDFSGADINNGKIVWQKTFKLNLPEDLKVVPATLHDFLDVVFEEDRNAPNTYLLKIIESNKN